MTPLRVVMITRRFWPLVGGAESVVANLAAEFLRQGVHCTVLTAQWERGWPREIMRHGVRVIRIPQPRWRYYGTWCYQRGLAAWLRRCREEYDLVYVSMLKHDAYAALGVACELKFPVVLRAEGAGVTGDCFWQLDANFGRRIKSRCLRADAFIAPSRAIEHELIAAGYPRERIHYLPNGVALRPVANDSMKRELRAALAEVEPALAVAPSAPVVIYTGRLHPAKGLATLVEAWRTVQGRLPEARLWLIGEGPLKAQLQQKIESLGLSGRVVIAGPFDQVDDLLLAADLFVLPSREEGMSIALLEAMSAGLPVIVSRIPGNEALVESDRSGLLVPLDDLQALSLAIVKLLEDRFLAVALGGHARQRVETESSLAAAVQAHLPLFETLVQRHADG